MIKEKRFIDIRKPKTNTAIILVGGMGVDTKGFSESVFSDCHIYDDVNERSFDIDIRKRDSDNKPNIVIVDWVKDGIDFINCISWLKRMEYVPENIHLVWIKGDVENALKQNHGIHTDDVVRESYDLLVKLFADIRSGAIPLEGRFDGDVWFVDGDSDTRVKTSGVSIDTSIVS